MKNFQSDKAVVEYFKGVEIDNIRDPLILQNVYDEIKDHVEALLLDHETSIKLEKLLENSNYEQCSLFLKSLNFKRISKRKLGSRIIEKCIDILCKKGLKEDEIIYLRSKCEKYFIDFFIDLNATYVLRKLIENVLEYIFLKKFTKLVRQNMKSIFENDIFIITLEKYMKKIERKKVQKIVKHILVEDNIFNLDDLKTKRSHFYEFLIECSDEKNIERFFELIDPYFLDLCCDKNGNYLIQKLIKSDQHNAAKYYNILKNNLDEFNENSNIVYQLILSLSNSKDVENKKKAHKLISKFYIKGSKEDIFKLMLFKKGDQVDSKYVNIVEKLFKFPKDINYEVLRLFDNYFEKSWVFEKNGRTLLKAYFDSDIDSNKKIKLIRSVKEDFKKLASEKYGRELLEVMKRCCDKEMSISIEKILKRTNITKYKRNK